MSAPKTFEGGSVWAGTPGSTGWVTVREVTDNIEVVLKGHSVTMSPAAALALANHIRRAVRRQNRRVIK